MKTYRYPNSMENVPAAVSFLSGAVNSRRRKDGKGGDHIDYLSRMLEYIAQSYPAGETVTLEVFRSLGDVKLRIWFKGEKLDTDRLIKYALRSDIISGVDDVDVVKLRRIYANYFESSALSSKYSDDGMNTSTIQVRRSSYRALAVLMIALFGGILLGFLLRILLPETAGIYVADNLLSSVSKIFVNCVKMLIGPLMFFTISSSIASYSDLSALGRIGKKLTLRYFINAVIAICIAIVILLVIKPGADHSVVPSETMLAEETGVAETVSENSVSVKDTIVGFFPGNFFKAFVDQSMMQIIFISFLLGIAAGLLDAGHRDGIDRFLSSGNRLFCKMVDLVMLFMPISVFCSMANTVIVMGFQTILMLIKWIAALILAFVVMSAIYILFTWLFTHVKPGTFLKKFSEAIIATFAMGSCNASMPACISALQKRMGVPERTTAFTVPIGVSIHCASNCIFYLISAFFLASIYTGVSPDPLAYPAILFSVFVLGIGAPSISGSGPICVAMLLPQLGAPMGLITLIIGLDPLISMFKSACSCIEDASVTLSIARSENTLDDKALNS